MEGVYRVLVGVTGGIAAYKIPLLVRLLRKNGCEVKVALTNAAKTLVGVDALRTLSGSPVYLDAGGGAEYDMNHIRLSEWADVFLVCPATANTIAKISAGIADNLLSTLALSIPEEKIIVVPAMNSVMWANCATQANINTLAARGITVLPVESGELACGVCGPGRMLGIDEIGRLVLARFGLKPLKNNKLADDGANSGSKTSSNDTLSGAKSLSNNELACNIALNGSKTSSSDTLSGAKSLRDNGLACNVAHSGGKISPVSNGSGNLLRDNELAYLKGKTVLISSGPTEEPIDPVRVITNRSSGKMGAALAKAALSAGARVVVVSGPVAEPLPAGAEVVYVKTAAEMEREMGERFKAADVCVMAAAVSDYRPLNFSEAKMRRSDNGNITIELTPNHDILAGLGAAKSEKQFLVGFALESGKSIKDIKRAKDKMKKKRCDMMVFNRVDDALGGDSTSFLIFYANGGAEDFPAMGKYDAARIIFNKINGLARR